MAIKAWPKWIPAHLITVAQISQMVVGTSLCIASYYYKKVRPSFLPSFLSLRHSFFECNNHRAGNIQTDSPLPPSLPPSLPPFRLPSLFPSLPPSLPFLKPQDGYPCAVEWENVTSGALMYGSYLYLFSEFFVRRFLLSSGKPKAKTI